jgi:hypothetical protein
MVNGGQFDLFVALLDAGGNLLSLTQTGNERPQHPAAVTLADNGDIVVVGYDDEFVVGTRSSPGRTVLSAASTSGPDNSIDFVSWSASDTSPADLVTSVARAMDGSGDVFIGTVVSTTPARGGGIRVRRVGAQNNVVWSTTLSTLSLDYIAALVVAPSGRLYAAGTTIGPVFGPPLGNSDGFVAELDPASGAPLNSIQIGSVGGDWIFSLATVGRGDLYALGVATDEVVAGFHGDGRAVPFVLTLSADLEVLGGWQHDAPSLPRRRHDGRRAGRLRGQGARRRQRAIGRHRFGAFHSRRRRRRRDRHAGWDIRRPFRQRLTFAAIRHCALLRVVSVINGSVRHAPR